MGNVPENFKGVKGKSGRKTYWEENNKVEAVNTLWEKVNKKVQAGKELTKFEQDLVKVLLPKTIKDKTEVDFNLKVSFDESFDPSRKTETNS